MIRVRTYDTQPKEIKASGVQPGIAFPVVRDVSHTEGRKTLEVMLDAGTKLTGIAAKEYVKDETARVSSALLDFQGQLAAEKARYMQKNKGKDALNAGEDFGGFARETMSRVKAAHGFSGRFDEMFTEQAAGTALNFTEQGMSYARQQRDAFNQSVRESEISAYMNDVAENYNNPDWLQYNSALFDKRMEDLNPGMDNRSLLSGIHQKAAVSIVNTYLGKGDLAGARQAAEQYGDYLGAQKNAMLGKIRDESISQMRLAMSMDEYNHRIAERNRKAQADEAEKSLTDLYVSGGLSVSDVRNARSVLSPDDYRAWTERAVRGWEPASRDEPSVFVSLTDKALRGEDVTQEAKQAYLDGKITQSTFINLTTRERDAETDELSTYISNALKPSPLNPETGRAESYANAMDEWNQWLRRHKDAGYQEKRDMAQSIARRYSFMDRGSMSLTMPMPRFFEGARGDMNMTTLKEAAVRTEAAYAAGRLSEEEYDEQCQIIENLRQTLARLGQNGTEKTGQDRPGQARKSFNYGVE